MLSAPAESNLSTPCTFNFSAASPMALAASSMSLAKDWNSAFCCANSRLRMRCASDLLWSRSFACMSERNFAFSVSAALSLLPVANLIECRGDDFLLTLRHAAFVFFAATTAASAHLLRLRILAFERLGFEEEHVAHGFGARVLRTRVRATTSPG